MLFSLGFMLRMCGFLNMVIETNWLKTVLNVNQPVCTPAKVYKPVL